MRDRECQGGVSEGPAGLTLEVHADRFWNSRLYRDVVRMRTSGMGRSKHSRRYFIVAAQGASPRLHLKCTVQVELENYPGVSGKFCFLIVMRTYPAVG